MRGRDRSAGGLGESDAHAPGPAAGGGRRPQQRHTVGRLDVQVEHPDGVRGGQAAQDALGDSPRLLLGEVPGGGGEISARIACVHARARAGTHARTHARTHALTHARTRTRTHTRGCTHTVVSQIQASGSFGAEVVDDNIFEWCTTN